MRKVKLFIQTSNLDELRRMMKSYGNSLEEIVSKNSAGEETRASINPDNIIVDTFQNDGNIRCNVVFYNGDTEESIVGKWK